MKHILFSTIFLLNIVFHQVYGQEDYIDVRKLPVPDCSGKTSIWNDFNKNITKILVIPDNPSDSVEFFRMFNHIKELFVDSLIKKESQLIESDFKVGLAIYGLINDFNNWNRFNLPIDQISNGFLFNGIEYSKNSDGIYFISNDRVVYSGNSLEEIWKLQSTVAALYKYMIFKNGLMDKLCINDSTIIDVAKIRESNYNKSSTKYYNLFVDKKLGEINISDSIILDICDKTQLPLPEFKINAFLHNDPNATRLFSNFYFMTGCETLEPTMKFGNVQFDGIHTTGNDINFVKHETFHYVWEKLVGESPNEFFNEGIQKYYEFLNDTAVSSYAKNIQQKYADYDLTNLVTVGNKEVFWNDAPRENNWTIAYELSGLFVKYLIDNWGLNKFKQFFVSKNIEESFIKYYELTSKEIILNYNQWVKNNY
ncbi:MAG: hypothetical protein KGZ97_01300 [Bacteroidetes bacterium]|nr:hypothetical protein [Bacteroidota bacterium]